MEDKKPRKPSIARVVLKAIKSGRLYDKESKAEGAKVVKAVKAEYPKSKFDLTQYFWYISRYKRQADNGMLTDHLVVMGKGTRQRAGKAAKASKATKAARKHGAKAKGQRAPKKAAAETRPTQTDAVEA